MPFLGRLPRPRLRGVRSPSQAGPRHLDADMEMVQDTFRAFANNVVAPHAEHVHRTNGDVPEEIISGLAEIGAFGLSRAGRLRRLQRGRRREYIAMVVATEELSRASLGIGGSLITRPEILTRALVKGGTEEQKQEWLPKLATAEVMAGRCRHRARLRQRRRRAQGHGHPRRRARRRAGLRHQRRQDVVHVRGPGRRADAAGPHRPRPLEAAHRGLSLFIVPKPRGDGHGFEFSAGRAAGGHGGPPDRHHRLPRHALLRDRPRGLVGAGGQPDRRATTGLGRGFYYQMEGFENGRLQTAARAVGVMQAAYEQALDYARNRTVFGSNILDYQLTRVKLGRMAVLIQAGRQFAYAVATLMAKGQGATEASMVKAYVCKAAEWVTREAMQIHGGFGYAEEYAVSRLFVDARVLSIFEGADETLCLKVIARRLVPA